LNSGIAARLPTWGITKSDITQVRDCPRKSLICGALLLRDITGSAVWGHLSE